MTFINVLMSFLSSAISFLGDCFSKLLHFLSIPFGWLIALLDGIWYFLTVLFNIVVSIIMIFVALFQFIGALVGGFMREIRGLLSLNFNQTPINFPSASKTGFQLVLDVLQPIGFLTVVPLVLLAILWIYFVIRLMSLLGGETNINA